MFFLCRAAIVFIGTYTFFKACVAMVTVYEINSWRYFAVVSLRMERKSWKWFNPSAWKSRRHRESRADRRFGGELREGTGSDFRADRQNREAKSELKMFYVFQWTERDAISRRVSCVSTLKVVYHLAMTYLHYLFQDEQFLHLNGIQSPNDI